MASQPEDIFVQPSTSDEAEVCQTEEELIDELQLQEILLESLRGTSQDTPQQRLEFLSTIKSIKGKLKKLRRQRDLSQSSSRVCGNHSTSQPAPPIMEVIDLTDSTPASPYVRPKFDDRSRGASLSTRNNTGGTLNGRKRTFATHLGAEHPSLPDNKSRRTTPIVEGSNANTPANAFFGYSDSSSTIDLSGDENEESAWRTLHKKEEDRFRRLKEQEEADASWAQQLHASENMLNLPSAQEFSFGGVDSFDDIQNRASQFSQSQQAGPSSSTLGQLANPFASSIGPGSATTRLPSHIKSRSSSSLAEPDHSSTMLDPLSDQTRGWPGLLSDVSGSTMPGTWDEELFGLEPEAGSSLTADELKLFGLDDPFMNDLNATSSSAESDFEITGVAPVGPRPGTLVNGRMNVLRNGTSNRGNSLSDIINRTNNFDFMNGLDNLGNPLPYDTMNILRGLEFTQNSYGSGPVTNQQLKDLLANIPVDADVDNQADTPDGFINPLYLHQKIALKWMHNMEADETKKGGILADDMGLGKTISTLALVLTRPASPLPGSLYPNPTLIVAPVSLIRQWEREAMTKIRPGRHSLAVLNAHDPSNKNKSYTQFKQFDIVLTTYDKLSREAKAFDDYLKTQASNQDPVDDDYILKQFPFMGPKSMFHRIVLDEAQAIKNAKALRFKAVRRLQATYRWVLTGTPMMNGVEELSSLISFLRIKPYNDFMHFKHTYQSLMTRGGRNYGKEAAMKKLQALLKAIMLRRTKQSEINGQPIIQLRPKIEMVDHVVFGADEEDYYRSLEKESQVTMSKFLRDGSVDLEFVNNDTPIQDMLANADKLKSDAVQRIITRITDKEPFECPICYEPTENPSILLCGHNTCTDCLLQLRQKAEATNIQAGNEALGAKSTCPECREAVDFSVYITCDIFKQKYMKEQWDVEQAAAGHLSPATDEYETESDSLDDDTASESEGDVDDRGNLRGFIVEDDDDSDFSPVKTNSHRTKKHKKSKKSKSKGKEKEEPVQDHELAKLRKEANKNMVKRKRYMNYLKRIWLDSAKVTKCKDIIAEIQTSEEKIIVFSQWTMLLDLLEVQLSKELRLKHRRYDGAMNSKQRDAAVTDFANDDQIKVMLISLKAGNAGLNLTMASHVIIMDPFWNPFIENQAIDRAHRIGQTRDVKVHRLLVENTVEDRIIELQDRKRELVNAALDENAAREIGRLSANDLAFLFGIGNR